MSSNKASKSQLKAFTSFMAGLASSGGDIASVTAPPFILAPISLVEYTQYWAQSQQLFLDAADDGISGEERILRVLRWFISTLRGQYCSRNESMGSEKKPLNPFLGELFTGKWAVGDGEDFSVLAAEQVSHHPPISAFGIFNDNKGVTAEGYFGFKTSISATTIGVKQFGHTLLHLKNQDVSYLVTLPALHIEGIIYAAPYVELEGHSYIQSSDGYKIDLSYSGKGYFSGKKNTFKAQVLKDGAVINTVKGQWSGKSTLYKGDGKDKADQGMPFFDSVSTDQQKLTVKPIEAQDALETQKAWAPVRAAIIEGDYDKIHSEKSMIEQAQRDLRAEEKEKGETWQRKWFTEATSSKEDPTTDAVYRGLLEQLGEEGLFVRESNWRFSRDGYNSGNVHA
ncbi:Oxysterol-binding protein-like protein 4 [Yarrowia sp. C11]|nr:Oxysterol-binding protein-like protein 4 [Yarrowia sp. E02]KAG5371535.1 Oxysterol-binding protein-like protein 4 [Yarrowia sp. C11]